jgi:hypothetical protein
MKAFWDTAPWISLKYTDVSEVHTTSIAHIMELVGISETLVYSETTRSCNPESVHLKNSQ